MNEEFHPVVQLLLSRMTSHPEEFAWDDTRENTAIKPSYNHYEVARRWENWLDQVMSYANDEEEKALRNGLRAINLDILNNKVMDELLNGEERRAQAMREYERLQLEKAQAMAQMYKHQQMSGSYTTSGTAVGAGSAGSAGGLAGSSSSLYNAQQIYDALNKSYAALDAQKASDQAQNNQNIMSNIKNKLGL